MTAFGQAPHQVQRNAVRNAPGLRTGPCSSVSGWSRRKCLDGRHGVSQAAQLLHSTITRVYGGYIYSYWDYKPTYNWGGTTLCLHKVRTSLSQNFRLRMFTIIPDQALSILVPGLPSRLWCLILAPAAIYSDLGLQDLCEAQRKDKECRMDLRILNVSKTFQNHIC